MKENAQKIEKCMFNFQIYIKPTNIWVVLGLIFIIIDIVINDSRENA